MSLIGQGFRNSDQGLTYGFTKPSVNGKTEAVIVSFLKLEGDDAGELLKDKLFEYLEKIDLSKSEGGKYIVDEPIDKYWPVENMVNWLKEITERINAQPE